MREWEGDGNASVVMVSSGHVHGSDGSLKVINSN